MSLFLSRLDRGSRLRRWVLLEGRYGFFCRRQTLLAQLGLERLTKVLWESLGIALIQTQLFLTWVISLLLKRKGIEDKEAKPLEQKEG